MRKTLTEVTLPQWLGYLERWLETAGTTFFVGDDITICDLVIYTRMKWLRRGVSEITLNSYVKGSCRRRRCGAVALGRFLSCTVVVWNTHRGESVPRVYTERSDRPWV